MEANESLTAGKSDSREIARKLADAVAPEIMPRRYGGSQLNAVLSDLATSISEAAEVGTDPRFRHDGFRAEWLEDQKRRLVEFLTSVPAAFHRVSFKSTDDQTVRLFEVPAAQVEEQVNGLKDAEPQKLIRAYSTIWKHDRAVSELSSGEQGYNHREEWLHGNVELLELVADTYTGADDLVSPVLEWALIDALIHMRILDYGRSLQFSGLLKALASWQTISGPLIPAPAERSMGTRHPGARQTLLEAAIKRAIWSAFEIVFLVGTWAVARFLTTSATETWTLFTGVTSARWIIEVLRKWKAKADQQACDLTLLQMIWDMGIAHERVPTMNIGLLRHLLYRLEERGAEFSPYVYRILEKRYRREGSSGSLNGLG